MAVRQFIFVRADLSDNTWPPIVINNTAKSEACIEIKQTIGTLSNESNGLLHKWNDNWWEFATFCGGKMWESDAIMSLSLLNCSICPTGNLTRPPIPFQRLVINLLQNKKIHYILHIMVSEKKYQFERLVHFFLKLCCLQSLKLKHTPKFMRLLASMCILLSWNEDSIFLRTSFS